MNVKVELGCMTGAEEMTISPMYDPNSYKKWKETYQCRMLKMELPDQGTQKSSMTCPLCSKDLAITLASPKRIYFILQCALLLWAVVCWGMAAGAFFINMQNRPDFMNYIAIGFALVGGVAFLAAWFSEYVPAKWLGSDLVSISYDDVRNHAQAPGYAGMRGHKIIDVHIV